MKQPKDDDRYSVKNQCSTKKQQGITKKQHIVPKKIIKKWKQNVVITGQPENCPFDIEFRKGKEDRLPQSEGSKCFWVDHRWSQSFEVNANKFVEQLFFKLINRLENQSNNVVKFDFIKDKQTLTIIKYYELIKRRMYYKLNNSNEVFKNFVGVESGNFTKEQQKILELKYIGYYVNGEIRGMEWTQY